MRCIRGSSLTGNQTICGYGVCDKFIYTEYSPPQSIQSYLVMLACNIDLFFIADVIGVCKTVEEVTRLTTKSNREVSKRTLSLMDMSGKVVTVTLWGEEVSTNIMDGEYHVKWARQSL